MLKIMLWICFSLALGVTWLFLWEIFCDEYGSEFSCYKALVRQQPEQGGFYSKPQYILSLMKCMRDEYQDKQYLGSVYVVELHIRFYELLTEIADGVALILQDLVELSLKIVLHILALPFQVLASIFTSEEFVSVEQHLLCIVRKCYTYWFDAVGDFLHVQNRLQYPEQEKEAWATALRFWMELDTLVGQVSALVVARI